MTLENSTLDYLSFLPNWLEKKALPLWSTTGINPENHSVFEKLDEQGAPDIDANLRTRVQARQIFVFACAEQKGWMANSSSLINGISQFLDRHAKLSKTEYGFAHMLSVSGQLIDRRIDTYDIAFFLLAYAYKFKISGHSKDKYEAEQLLSFLDMKLRSEKGGWKEGDYLIDIRRQNPHMHLFESFLTWYEISKEPKWLAKAGQIFSLFEYAFFDVDTNVIKEYFSQNWSDTNDLKARIVEPGHMFEWVWLLRWYEQLTGTPVSTYCDVLYSKATQIGIETGTSLIFDEVEENGEIIKGTKRLWPLTEYIKASLVEASKYPEKAPEFEAKAALAIKTIIRFYLVRSPANENTDLDLQPVDIDKFEGRYIDQLDSQNRVLAGYSPASTLYHLTTAAVVCDDYINRRYGNRFHRNLHEVVTPIC